MGYSYDRIRRSAKVLLKGTQDWPRALWLQTMS